MYVNSLFKRLKIDLTQPEFEARHSDPEFKCKSLDNHFTKISE